MFLLALYLLISFFGQTELPINQAYKYSALSGLLGSSIYYTRKLYKDCFLDNKISTAKDGLKQTATIVYFVTRPFFAAAFSIMIIIGMKAGFIIISTDTNQINTDNFIYMSVFLSFVGGFRVGKFIKKFENFEFIK